MCSQYKLATLTSTFISHIYIASSHIFIGLVQHVHVGSFIPAAYLA